MREELKSLMDLVKEYNELSDAFSDKRNKFNLKVEKLCDDYDCIIYPVGLSQEGMDNLDYYDKAKMFFNANSEIIDKFHNIRNLNRDADVRKLFTLYVRCLTRNYGIDPELAYFFVSNYTVLNEAGYYDIAEAEDDINDTLTIITDQAEALKAQGLDSIGKSVEALKGKAIYAGQEARTILEPYAAEAKSRLEPYATEAKAKLEPYAAEVKKGFTAVVDRTKPFVHDGSKSLVKVFTKLADRTRPTTDKEKKND